MYTILILGSNWYPGRGNKKKRILNVQIEEKKQVAFDILSQYSKFVMACLGNQVRPCDLRLHLMKEIQIFLLHQEKKCISNLLIIYRSKQISSFKRFQSKIYIEHKERAHDLIFFEET